MVAVHEPANAATAVLADHPMVARVNHVDADEVAAALVAGARLAATRGPAQDRAAEALGERYRRDAQLAPRIAALTAATGATR